MRFQLNLIPACKHCVNGMHKGEKKLCTICTLDTLLHHRNRKKSKTGIELFSFFYSVDRKTETKQNETKKRHKNGNEKINFHLNGYLHINATYTLHTIITVSVSDFFLLFPFLRSFLFLSLMLGRSLTST